MHRFYIPFPDIQKDILTIAEPRVVFQCGRVLRMKVGSPFSVFDDAGVERAVLLLEIDRRRLAGRVTGKIAPRPEPHTAIALFQAIPKKPALFELVVQKATELGATDIYPLITARTENKFPGKKDRLRLIAIEAAEQCGRISIPAIHEPVLLADALKQAPHGLAAYENEVGKTLGDFRTHLKKGAAIFIGPEGGFTDDEVALMQKAGIGMFSLGPRVLRTETAAIAALAQLQLLAV